MGERARPAAPSVGRIVHYVSYGTPKGEYSSQCRAAVITQVLGSADSQEMVGLAVLNPTGLFFHEQTRHAEDGTPGGTWHWPCVIT
jgi:hypothetical protein